MLVIRGVNVFPSAVEEVLLRFEELSPNYRIFIDRPPNGLDEMLVEVEHHPDATLDIERLTRAVKARLADNDAYSVFAALNDLIMTGPTLTNVNDFRTVLITRKG